MKLLQKLRIILAIGITCAISTFPLFGSKKQESPTPNIIFLLADDLREDTLGCSGNKLIRTPNIDQLANDGVRFTQAFATTAICAMSRVSIMTGQYLRRHKINDFNTNLSPQALAQTYPSLLKKAGYQIGFVGKYGIGTKAPKKLFDYWTGFNGQGEYQTTDRAGNPIHLTRLICQQAITGIEKFQLSSKPFCLSISFKAPHAQDLAPEEFIYDNNFEGYYEKITIPHSNTHASSFFEKFPPFFKENNEGRLRWQKRFATEDLFQKSVKGYYRLITGIDYAVGEIRSSLTKLGIAQNTVIIFTSDHGFYLGEHGLAGKWYGHQESIKIPLIIYEPRQKERLSKNIRSEIALTIDIAPTILELAGQQPTTQMQGKSLIPLLTQQNIPWRSDFFYEHRFKHPRIHASEGVVSRRYKYLRYIDAKPLFEELYDLRVDPDETENLAISPEYQQILKSLRKRWQKLNIACQ